jgi:plasmid replication initiation protein
MSKKDEKTQILVGLGDPKKLVIQKSKPLLDIVRIGLPLDALKLLDAYLAKIDTYKPDNKTVVFEVKEYEEMLGIQRLRTEVLDANLDKLLNHVITLKNTANDEDDDVIKINLFQMARRRINKETRMGEIVLVCNDVAKDFIFKLDDIKYIKYNLEDIIKLNSRYSYTLFLYLKDNLYKKTWTISYPELKVRLGCESSRYSMFSYLKNDILNPCKKEIESKTGVRFTFEPIRKNRSVIAVTFTASEVKGLTDKKKADKKVDTDKMVDVESSKSASTVPVDNNEEKDWKAFYGSSVLAGLAEQCEYTFSKKEMQLIHALLKKINISPAEGDRTGTCRFGREAYLQEKYLRLCQEEENKAKNGESITNRFAYLRKMLENEAEEDSDE